MMSIPSMLLLFGGVLLLIAIIGGGFEMRELKVPRVEKIPRLLSAATGIVFVVMGVNYSEASLEEKKAQPAESRETPITFTLHDQLGELQESAQTIVLIDGKRVGTLTVNKHYPDAMLAVTVPAPGKYSYSLDSRIIFNDGQELVEYLGAGQGTINAEDSKKFENRYSTSGDAILLVLEEMQ